MSLGFEKQLSIGKKGEEEVADYFRNRNHIITDVSDDKAYQHKDIDLLLENQQGQHCSVEIKTDNRMAKTGNLFFEAGHERQTGYYDGWITYCEADYICFFDNTAKRGYVLDWKEAKPQLKNKAEFKTFYDYSDDCYADAYLLPIGTAKKMGWITHTFELAS